LSKTGWITGKGEGSLGERAVFSLKREVNAKIRTSGAGVVKAAARPLTHERGKVMVGEKESVKRDSNTLHR